MFFVMSYVKEKMWRIGKNVTKGENATYDL